MNCTRQLLIAACFVIAVFAWTRLPSHAHDHTAPRFLKSKQMARLRPATAVENESESTRAASCKLTLELRMPGESRPLHGLVRVTSVADEKPVRLSGHIARDADWYVVAPSATITVPRAKLRLEALHGLETERTTVTLDLTETEEKTVRVDLVRFYDAGAMGLKSGNTHLHLMNLTLAEADRYLRLVPKADDLDLVFLSHLRRIPDERHYISNIFVANSFSGGDLKRLSQDGVLFANGQEHRHNFGPYGEGYGHVMLLDLVRLIEPVSIGPGLMRTGTDGIPLQRAIRLARDDGASVIWCHNKFGLEDVPNWMAGLLHAQNIFDGGEHGSYEDTFYRYLNIGLKVPFSCGTDWFIYDFSRVYVPVADGLTSRKWLDQLAAGRSFITNGTFLEFRVGGQQVGDTINMPSPGRLNVAARGVGRDDFRMIELVHNGRVIRAADSRAVGGHFAAELTATVDVDEPGWFALRVPRHGGSNVFGKELFAHTSPVYVELNGKRAFDKETAYQLVAEMDAGIETIQEKGTFADPTEREAVLSVHRKGISILRSRIEQAD